MLLTKDLCEKNVYEKLHTCKLLKSNRSMLTSTTEKYRFLFSAVNDADFNITASSLKHVGKNLSVLDRESQKNEENNTLSNGVLDLQETGDYIKANLSEVDSYRCYKFCKTSKNFLSFSAFHDIKKQNQMALSNMPDVSVYPDLAFGVIFERRGAGLAITFCGFLRDIKTITWKRENMLHRRKCLGARSSFQNKTASICPRLLNFPLSLQVKKNDNDIYLNKFLLDLQTQKESTESAESRVETRSSTSYNPCIADYGYVVFFYGWDLFTGNVLELVHNPGKFQQIIS